MGQDVFKRSLWCVTASLALGLAGCGGGEKKENSVDTDQSGNPGDCTKAGCGWVTKAQGRTIKIAFPGSVKGAKYVVMPFSVGVVKNIQGATSDKFNITVSKPGGNLVPLKGPSQPLRETFTERDYHRGLKWLHNRFLSRRGFHQGEEFWALARYLDEMSAASGLSVSESSLPDTVTGRFQKLARQGLSRSLTEGRSSTFVDATCPKAGDKVLVPAAGGGYDEASTIAIGDAAEGDDYCIAYIDDPFTIDSKDAIKATVELVLKRYKQNFFKDTMAPTDGGFTFKPIIVVADFADPDSWPFRFQDAALHWGDGADIKQQPLLYIASDFAELSKYNGVKEDLLKSLWHSTLAHELYHAVVFYYRVQKGEGDMPSYAVDEGMAHFMEDVFGHGEDNFDGFQKAFLESFGLGLPFFANVETQTYRGAAHSFLYYLSSKKGGVTVESGVITGGGGIDYLVSVTKAAQTSGAEDLANSFGGDWVNVVGNYLGALMLDGTKIKTVKDVYKVQDVQTGIHDLVGHTDKVFGMRYNGYGGLGENRFESINTVADTESIDGVEFYSTRALLYTVTNPDGELTLTLDQDVVNAAASVVRIQ